LRFFAADLIRLANVPAVFVVYNRAEHHHAVAEGELRMRYRAVRTLVNCMLLETKHLAKPTDSRFGVTIAQPGNSRAARIFRSICHGFIR
jgi:hypothetical protein